ncbi:MAG: hypothetical protein LKJ90_01335 [Faecalibacterium sp.]|jgi:hypothetical protein|nr:hypothetical protein [Faecalibacterium sp.]
MLILIHINRNHLFVFSAELPRRKAGAASPQESITKKIQIDFTPFWRRKPEQTPFFYVDSAKMRCFLCCKTKKSRLRRAAGIEKSGI